MQKHQQKANKIGLHRRTTFYPSATTHGTGMRLREMRGEQQTGHGLLPPIAPEGSVVRHQSNGLAANSASPACDGPVIQ